MHRKIAALIVCVMLSPSLLPSGPARAQEGVSEADQQACTPDVFRLCSDFIPNEAPIVACLQAKRTQLSAACGLVMFPASPASHKTRTAASHRPHHRRLAREAAN